MIRLNFVTAIPLSRERGSGCFVGTQTLADALSLRGVQIEWITPRTFLPVYTATRLIFNQRLRNLHLDGDAVVGIDADGYTIAGGRNSLPHIACIKGVIGDAVPFESGFTRATMALQARLEAKHAQRADLAITVSRYCAERMGELYGVHNAAVVPELIDLNAWHDLFKRNPASPDPEKFTVLVVCRFYPRKRLDVLLGATAILRGRIPELQVRIVGGGPERAPLHRLAHELHLASQVCWLGDLSMDALASEYNGADVFCLPSTQEGFGIVFLEAMAAGKPIVAARAAAVPEVVRHGLLVEPGNPEALADALLQLYCNPELRARLGAEGNQSVAQYDAPRVAIRFLEQAATLVPALKDLTTA